MKLLAQSPRRREQGVAVIVVLALLAIMLLYAGANTRSLRDLGRELKLLERQQIKRLNARVGGTNAPTAQFPAAETNGISIASDLKSQPDFK
jgi:hypothetical protein